jgi:hypothetical protein
MTELAPPNAHASVAGLDAGTAGVTPPSESDRRGAFLADVVVELDFANRETIDEAVGMASQSGRTLERYLLENRIIDEAQLSLAVAERNGLDHVDLDRFEVDMTAAEMIDRTAALRYCAVPIAFAPDGALIVAVEDPLDPRAGRAATRGGLLGSRRDCGRVPPRDATRAVAAATRAGANPQLRRAAARGGRATAALGTCRHLVRGARSGRRARRPLSRAEDAARDHPQGGRPRPRRREPSRGACGRR